MDHPERIIKNHSNREAGPHISNYESSINQFHWKVVEQELQHFPDGKINLAYEAVDRHVVAGRGSHTAFRFINHTGQRNDVSYLELMKLSNQFANVLRSRGVKKGDRVFTLLGRFPETYITALGTLKNGSVYSPLFSAFGSEPIAARMVPGQGRVLVTTTARKIKRHLVSTPNLIEKTHKFGMLVLL